MPFTNPRPYCRPGCVGSLSTQYRFAQQFVVAPALRACGKLVAYTANKEQVTWDYQQGKDFCDTRLKEVADYYARQVSW